MGSEITKISFLYKTLFYSAADDKRHPETRNANEKRCFGRSKKGSPWVASFFPSDLSASCGVSVSRKEFLRLPVRGGVDRSLRSQCGAFSSGLSMQLENKPRISTLQLQTTTLGPSI